MALRKVREHVSAMLLVVGLIAGGLALVAVTPDPASAAGFGTGAVSIKGPQTELIPGVTVEIRQNDCNGPAVWYTTTGSSPQAYGAFGIGLEAGDYCVVTLAAPSPYTTTMPVMFTMEPRTGNWVTVWLPVLNTVTGAVVAKDADGNGVNGVTAFIQVGECGTGGQGVWRNTTATSRWSVGGFGIALGLGLHCVTVEAVPAGFAIPAPVTVNVVHPSPMWITLWIPSQPFTGSVDSVIPIDFSSGEKIVKFSCTACTSNTVLWAHDANGPRDLLVNEIGSYTGRHLVGVGDWEPVHYTMLEVEATGSWSLEIQDASRALSVTNHATGSGDDVVRFSSSGTVANIANSGSGNFIVWSRDRAGNVDLLVNEIGPYWGTRPINSPSVMQVLSDGAWDIRVG